MPKIELVVEGTREHQKGTSLDPLTNASLSVLKEEKVYGMDYVVGCAKEKDEKNEYFVANYSKLFPWIRLQFFLLSLLLGQMQKDSIKQLRKI